MFSIVMLNLGVATSAVPVKIDSNSRDFEYSNARFQYGHHTGWWNCIENDQVGARKMETKHFVLSLQQKPVLSID